MGGPLTITLDGQRAGQTLGAVVRTMAGASWGQAKRWIVGRRVEVNGVLCVQDARRLKAGDVVTLNEESAAPVPDESAVRLLRVDPDLVVLDKPAAMITLRRDEEQGFSQVKKDRQPALDEALRRMLWPNPRGKRGRGRSEEPPLYAVHRLDRDTSGLMVFALSVRGRDALIRLFSRHEVVRTYLAAVHGVLGEPRTFCSWIVRDRGDGLRGSSPAGPEAAGAQEAVTHVRPLESIGGRYSLVECRLQTGRTHQIRIHLSEAGHMLCGEKLYRQARAGESIREDSSGAPRQALHSASLRLTHPITGEALAFESPLPADLWRWLERLRGGTG